MPWCMPWSAAEVEDGELCDELWPLGQVEIHENFTEAGRELADPAGVAASAIRRMSPFWFFLELWDLVRLGTGSGPGGGGQTSL